MSAAGYSTLQVGYLLSIAMLGSTGMTLLVGISFDRYGRKPVLMAIAALAAIGTGVHALTTSFWLLSAMQLIGKIKRLFCSREERSRGEYLQPLRRIDSM